MIEIIPDWITEEDEKHYLALVEYHFKNNQHQVGTGGNRSRIMRFGYDYKDPKISRESPLWLVNLGSSLAWKEGRGFDSYTINEYKPGDKIEPHIDSPDFDDLIAILSLGADCVWKMDTDRIHTVELLPRRSLLKMTGEHRYKWKHSIPPLQGKDTRISIVFRKRLVGLPVVKSNGLTITEEEIQKKL